MLDSKKLTKYRKQLEELETRLDADSRMRADLLPEVMKANGDLSDVPTHPADHDVEELTAEIGVAQIQDHLREHVSEALSRIQNGTYGLCENCGQEISRERLDAIPYTPFCVECERKVEAE